MDNFSAMMLKIGENFLLFAAVLIIGVLIVKLITHFVRKLILKTKLDHTVKTFLFSVIRVVLYAFVVITALGTIGVNVDSIITAFGAALLTAGFALQDTLKNLVSGLIILFSKPFTAGDLIEFEGVEGYVQSIRIFYTTITDYNNKSVKIPNSRLTANNVTNCSEGEYRRVPLVFSVSYDDNLAQVKSVIYDVIAKNEKILSEPEPKVYISDHLDSGVEIKVFVWADPSDYFSVLFSMEEQVKLAFDENGITIPYPHLEIKNNT